MNRNIIYFLTFVLMGVGLLDNNIFTISVGTLVRANGMMVQSDGKIVMVGYSLIDEANHVFLSRYNTDGSLDTTFSSDGIATSIVGTGGYGNAVVEDGSGNLYVSGRCSAKKFCLMRYSSAGVMDMTFGSLADGCEKTVIGDYAHAYSIALDGSGKVISAGMTIDNGTKKMAVTRHSSAGVIDTTFGASGIVKLLIDKKSVCRAMLLQSDGKIVLVGDAASGRSEHIALARLNSDGSVDTTFGTNGVVQTVVGLNSHAYGMTIQLDGKIIVTGVSNGHVVVVRYASDGSLDATFGTSGMVTTTLGKQSVGSDVAVQTDGKVVITGSAKLTSGTSKNFRMFAIRYSPTGVIDTTLDVDGIATFAIGSDSQSRAMAILSDGKIMMAGSSDEDVALIRMNSNGLIDGTFGDGGVVIDPGGSDSIGATYIWDEKASGTAGGTFTAGSWQVRDLNTLYGKRGNVLLSGNEITLSPGVYEVFVQAPALEVGLHKIRLNNVTDGVIEKVGSSAKASAGGDVTMSTLSHLLYVPKTNGYKIQHKCTITKADDGFGLATGLSDEIYTQIRIIQRS